MEANVEKTDRNARIRRLHRQGRSLNQIARQLVAEGFEQISAQRVKQILDKPPRKPKRKPKTQVVNAGKVG